MIDTILLARSPEMNHLPASNVRTNGDELAEQLNAILQSQFGCHVRNLHVTMTEKGLILEGTVGSYHGKQLTQHAARKIFNKTIAENNIYVS